MPRWLIKLPNGERYQIESERELTPEEINQALGVSQPEPQEAAPEPVEPEKTSAAGAFGRSAAAGVIPAGGSLAGAIAGAKLGAAIPIPHPLVKAGFALGGGLIGAIAGGIGASKGQEAVAEAVAPEATQQFMESLARGQEEHPVASLAGRFASAVPVFTVSPGKALSEVAALAKGGAAARQAAISLAAKTGAGGAMGVVSPLLEGQTPTLAGVAEMAAFPLVFGQPRFWRGAPPPTAKAPPKRETAKTETKAEPVPLTPEQEAVDIARLEKEMGETPEPPAEPIPAPKPPAPPAPEVRREPNLFKELTDEQLYDRLQEFRGRYKPGGKVPNVITQIREELAHRAGKPEGTLWGNFGFLEESSRPPAPEVAAVKPEGPKAELSPPAAVETAAAEPVVEAKPAVAETPATPVEAKPPATVKQPWEMTRSEALADAKEKAKVELEQMGPQQPMYLRGKGGKAIDNPKYDVERSTRADLADTIKAEDTSEWWNLMGVNHPLTIHRRIVEKALREGKPVPPEVLKDYPDLQKPPAPPETGKIYEQNIEAVSKSSEVGTGQKVPSTEKVSQAPKARTLITDSKTGKTRRLLPVEQEFLDSHGVTIQEAIAKGSIRPVKEISRYGKERVVGYQPNAADSYQFGSAHEAMVKQKELRAIAESKITPDEKLRESVWKDMTDAEHRSVRQDPRIFELPNGALDWEVLKPFAEKQGKTQPTPPPQAAKMVEQEVKQVARSELQAADDFAGKASSEAEKATVAWATHVEDVVNPLKAKIRKIQSEVGQMAGDAKRTLPETKGKSKLTKKAFFEQYGVNSMDEANALYKRKNAEWAELEKQLEAAEVKRRELELVKERRGKEWSSAATRAGELRRQVYPKVKEGDVGQPPPAAPGAETGNVNRPGPGGLSPSEFAERQAGADRVPPPSNPPVAVDGGSAPKPEVVRANRDLNILNRINSGQWNFYFGRLGQAAKSAWERLALGEFKMRESIQRDVMQFVDEPLKQLPRPLRKQSGKLFTEIMDGKTMESIESEWQGKPQGEVVIEQARRVKTRLEEIRTTMRDIKRDSLNRKLNGMSKEDLSDLFRKNIDENVDITNYSKESLADALTMESIPDGWGISDGSYLPHVFFGQWKVTVKLPGQDVNQFVTRSETPHEAEAKIYKMTKANPELRNAEFKVELDTVVPADMLRLGDRQFWRMIGRMKEQGQGEVDPKAAVQGIIGRKATKEKYFGATKRREGYEGYSKDYQRLMTAYLNGFHRWKELTAANREVQPLIEQVRQEGRPNAAQRLEDILDNLWGKPTRTTLEFDAKLRTIPIVRDFVKPLALDRWAKMANALTTNLTLRTLRFGVVNRLQPLQGLYPLVGERILTQAKIKQHTPEGRALLEEAGVTVDPGQYAGEHSSRYGIEKVIERMSGERSNQELAFLAMYQHGIESGKSHPEAIRYAKLRGQLGTQFTPLVVDTPQLFEGPVGRVLFQFKRFPVKQVELISQMAADKDIPALARLVLTYAAIGGASVFMRQAFQDQESRLRLKRKLDKEYGEKTADAIMYGLPGMVGADISGSIALGDEPFGSNIYEKIGRTAVGPGPSLAIETARSVAKEPRVPMSPGERALATARKIPTLKPLVEIIGLANDNIDIQTPDGEVKYRRALRDAIAGLGSFRSANEANIQTAVAGIMEIEKEMSTLKNRYFVALRQSPEAVAEVRSEIKSFNERWPEAALGHKQLNDYVKYRRRNEIKTDAERIAEGRMKRMLPESQRIRPQKAVRGMNP